MVCPMLSDCCLSLLSVCHVGVLLPNGWMDQDETWQGGRSQPRLHCVRWGSSFGGRRWPRPHCVRSGPSSTPAPRKGHSSSPSFRPFSIVAKRSPISATAEHLLHRSRQGIVILYKRPPLSPLIITPSHERIWTAS